MRRILAIHPFLFAIFPVLFLFAYNIDEVPATDLLLPMLVVIIGTLILLLSLRLITKNYNKIAVIASAFVILFFSYIHIRRLFLFIDIAGSIYKILLWGCLWALLFIAVAFLIIKSRRDFSIATKFLNVVAITLIAISLINIGIYEVKAFNLMTETTDGKPASVDLKDSDNLPDIYYIILDGYARADTLKENYNYDNGEFTDYLANKGFYIASRSRSQYMSTVHSLASSLNMNYITEPKNYSELLEMLQNNKVSQLLKSKGYRYIFITSGALEKGINKYADLYTSQQHIFGMKVSRFAVYLIESTPFNHFTFGFIGHNTREGVLYCFDKLADMPSIKEPTFVFAHIVCPHSPYVFDRNGNPVKPMERKATLKERKEKYLDQLIFVNKKVETLVDELLSKSEVAPIVILQADHGPKQEMGRQYEILNAYYLTGKDNQLLYETITPVNSFRIIFNLYFDTNFDLLED